MCIRDRRNGVDLRVLGWGVKWEGLSQKLAAALAAVDALPADCVVLFTDAYDVLFAASGARMRRDFLALDQPLVFAGECGCWPQVQRDRGKTCRDLYPKSPTPYRYLNSGAWMGRAGVAARFLRRLVDTAGAEGAAFHKLNDQELAAELYFSGEFGPELGLDHYARLFSACTACATRRSSRTATPGRTSRSATARSRTRGPSPCPRSTTSTAAASATT